MLRRAIPLLATLAATALLGVACDEGTADKDGSITPINDNGGVDAGGDTSGSETTDTSPDGTPDTSPDTAPDVTPDTAPDTSPDVAPDTNPDVGPTTCTSNDQCPNGHYCAADGCDVPGTCTAIPPIGCDAVYDPVCGCNGNTYGNSCEALAAGVNVDFEGECPSTCTPFTCPADQIPVDSSGDGCSDTCLCFDGNAPGPNGCPTPDPKALQCVETGGTWDFGACGDYVCGVPNNCKAAIPGCDCGPNANFKDGEGCVSDPNCSTGDACGGLTGLPCDDKEFCEKDAGQCGVSDGIGQCVGIPEACTFEEVPVCGCDGVTYSNDCFRQSASVQKAYDGECSTCEPLSCDLGTFPDDTNGDGCFDTCLCSDGTPAGPAGCPKSDDQQLCENTNGTWDPFACMHYNCGNPNLCLAIIPGCNCGSDANFVEGEGCVADPTCQGDDAKKVCEQTGGTWDDTACGDYYCGTPNDCDAVIPGCDCGPGKNYADGEGCVADPSCQGDDPQSLCEQSGGTWDETACGDYYCGAPNACDAIIPGCDCGPGENYIEGQGCQSDPSCDGGTLFCGGFAGSPCPTGQYCEYEKCGIADDLGVCQVSPDFCLDIYDPVCGCDGQTYGNDCQRQAAGASLAYTGECQNPTP